MILWQFKLGNQCHENGSDTCVQYTFQSQWHSKQLRDHQRRPIRHVVLFALLLFVQNIEVRMCRTLKSEVSEGSLDEVKERLRDLNTLHVSNFRNNAVANIVHDKRNDKGTTSIATYGHASQPEEIFSVPNGGDVDMNYDEYPMVVPKRAALLLDRLMVALHHALEQERSGHRISQFYANQDKVRQGPNNQANIPNSIIKDEMHYNNGEDHSDNDDNYGTTNVNTNANANNNVNFHMYSDDDPNVMLDYDFKDLNSINRATGETLMAKSFQRRANMGGGSGGIDMEGMALLSNAAAALNLDSGGGGGGRRINIGNGGRMYWRCYFNAVSCF